MTTPLKEKNRVEIRPGSAGEENSDHLPIQKSIDRMGDLGGGTVVLKEGDYLLRNSLVMRSGVSLEGAGEATRLRIAPSESRTLSRDLDWYETSFPIEDIADFRTNDGIYLFCSPEKDPRGGPFALRTIERVHEGRLHLTDLAGASFWLENNPRVARFHNFIEAKEARDFSIRSLALEGAGNGTPKMDSNTGAMISLMRCSSVEISNVFLGNFNGDAISWQVCDDVSVKHCSIFDISGTALHPGSGSLRPQILDNDIRRCFVGIFWCWGVRDGLAEGNSIEDCALHGISLGHRDTDNCIRNNTLRSCREAAVFFRPERDARKTAHRCRIENNRIHCHPLHECSTGISVCRGVQDVLLKENAISLNGNDSAVAISIDPAAVRTLIQPSKDSAGL